MNSDFMPAAIVLSAGYSSRMGDFKPLLPIGSQPAIVHVIRNLKKAGVRHIGVVTGHLRDKLEPIITSEGIDEIYNPNYDRGMFSSILSGIKYFTETTIPFSGALLSPVDCPLVPAEIIKEILNVASFEKSRFVVPCYRGKKGHPLWIPSVVFKEIECHDGKMGLKGVTSRYDSEMIRLDTENEGVLLDMDTPVAYEKLLSFYKNGSNIEDFRKLSKDRRFILIRHGKPVQHREKIFLGQYDPPLGTIGIWQAKSASEELIKLNPDTHKIYSSNLKRALQTAVEIGKELKITNIEYMSGLREMSLGAWDGKYMSDIKDSMPDEYEKRGNNLLTYKIDDKAENFYDLQYRVLDCVSDILRHDQKRDIILVTHSGVIKALYGNLKGHDIEWALNKIKPTNGSVTVIEQHLQ